MSEDVTPKSQERPYSDPRAPWQGRASFDCPMCGAFAAQEWSPLFRRIREGSIEAGIAPSFEMSFDSKPRERYGAPPSWSQAQCFACKNFHTWRDGRLMYPSSSVIPLPLDEMPERAKTLYFESRDVAAVSKRAGAAMARATLEVLLRILLPDAPAGARLEDLTVLAELEVSVGLATRLIAVRESGNKSVHPKLDPADEPDLLVLVLSEQSDEMIAMLFDTINRVVTEMIVEKADNDRFAALIPDGVMDGVRRARKRLLGSAN